MQRGGAMVQKGEATLEVRGEPETIAAVATTVGVMLATGGARRVGVEGLVIIFKNEELAEEARIGMSRAMARLGHAATVTVRATPAQEGGGS